MYSQNGSLNILLDAVPDTHNWFLTNARSGGFVECQINSKDPLDTKRSGYACKPNAVESVKSALIDLGKQEKDNE